MKKKIILSLMVAIAAIIMSLTVKGNATVKAEATGVNKDTFASYFTAVGDNGLVDYVDSITYGEFTTDNFSGGGIMVRTRNKTTELKDVTDNSNDTNPMLINFPTVKYSTGVKFNGVVDLSDNTHDDDTLIELAFPGENDNWQCRGFKVIIEDASNPDKYITLFVWSPYGNSDATGGSMLAAAAASWEKTNMSNAPVLIGEAGFDTDDYDGNGTGRLMIVGDAINTDGYGDSAASDGEGCFINSKEHGHEKTSVNLSRTSANSFKIQFNNNTGLLSINGVRVRLFSKFSAVYPDNNGNARVKKYGSNVYDKFAGNKVKLSVGVVRTTRRSTDEFTRFCIMSIDGTNLKADNENNIAYNISSVSTPSSVSKDVVVSKFVAVGDEKNNVNYSSYVNNISYGEFSADKFSGGGVMVQIRNKTAELVDNTDNNNETNPILVNFPGTKYTTGVKFAGSIDISDNTAYDTLLEIAFPGENDNYQVRGFKVIIEDASDTNNYIALYIWNAYGNTDALDTGKSSIVAAAVGSWETTNANSVTNAAFDTDDYNNDDVPDDGRLIKCIGVDTVDTSSDEICWLNAGGSSHGARVTSVRFSRKSDNTFKIQFDNATGTLLVNGVRIRKFSAYSTDDEHYYEGFTNDKVTVSVGVLRSVRRSTDEFTRFCIMQIDGNGLKADTNNEVHYYGGFDEAPKSGLIASGNTTIPAPMHHDLFAEATAIESGVSVSITDPNNKVTENYTGAKFDFDLIGTYKIEYFVNGTSLGTTQFRTAAKDGEGNLSELASFDVTSGLYAGKNITLADFTVMADAQLTFASATVTIYNGETVLATETADANWSYTLPAKGELTFKVATDSFTVTTTATVLPGVFPTAAIENGSVSINGQGSAIGLNSDLLTFTLTPAEGYRLKSLMIDGQDVTADVEDGEYELEPETMTNNITYTATFEAIPKFTVTYKDGETTVGTVSDVIEGTLFKDVTAPTAPTKAGYTFTGWSLDANSAITADVTATAQYETITYTITYNLDGGTNSTENKATYTVEDAFTLANPTKEGYKFLGWSNEASEAVTAVALGTTGNLTFTAHWEADEPVNPGTQTQTTQAPVTQAPVTQAPVTQAPVTQAPVTQAPATQAPATQAPATQAPNTQAPATQAPATQAPAETGKKKGCKSFVESLPIFALLLVPAAAVVIKRKREE